MSTQIRPLSAIGYPYCSISTDGDVLNGDCQIPVITAEDFIHDPDDRPDYRRYIVFPDDISGIKLVDWLWAMAETWWDISPKQLPIQLPALQAALKMTKEYYCIPPNRKRMFPYTYFTGLRNSTEITPENCPEFVVVDDGTVWNTKTVKYPLLSRYDSESEMMVCEYMGPPLISGEKGGLSFTYYPDPPVERVDCIVAYAFLHRLPNTEIVHKDGDPKNCSLKNLEVRNIFREHK